MSHQRLVVTALVLGLVLGSLAPSVPAGLHVVRWVEPLGTLWINALRMAVVPLVVSLLVVGVASIADTGLIRRIGAGALAAWVGLLLVSAALGLTVVPFLFSGLSIGPEATEALRQGAATTAAATARDLERIPTFSQWLVDIVPVNPIRAAADGAMLPVVIFSLTMGLAASRLQQQQREVFVRFFDASAQAMLVIVRWVLVVAPVGVFSLSIGIAARIGLSAAGAIGYYLGVTALTMSLLVLLILTITSIAGRVSPLALARALLPALVVGFTSRSSLASLPAQVDGTTVGLGLPAHTVGFVLPLAVASFKPHAPLNWSSLALFSALLYGVPIGPAELLTVVTSALLLSFAVPGIPSAGMLLIAPVFATIGVPFEAIGVLIAVDAIPDMFKTVANVTGQFGSAVIVARLT